MENEELFGEHLDLNTVSATLQPIPAGMYDLQIRRLKRKKFVYKSGKKAGEAGVNIDIRFVVTNHPEHSGYVLDRTLWPSETSKRYCKCLLDATGIEQTGTFDDWAQDMTDAAPIVKMFVLNVLDSRAEVMEGETVPSVNIISFKDIQAADDNAVDILD